MSFYNKLSPFYDDMISLKKRLDSEQGIYNQILQKYPAKTILDAGCGSGYHSIVLSKGGAEVTGFDPEEEMLALAQNNALEFDCKIEFVRAGFLDYHSKINNKFSAIYTLGNSFVHLESPDEMLQCLKYFKESLLPGGYVCIGIVNYDKYLKYGLTEISKKEKNGRIFHRYYQYDFEHVIFNVEVAEGGNRFHFKTRLFPVTSDRLEKLANLAGFSQTVFYGNLKSSEYQPFNSENICAFLY